MNMKEFKDVPEGKRGETFIKKSISGLGYNNETKEVEGTASITIEPFQQKRNKSIFERAFENAGLNIFEVKSQCRNNERQLATV